MCMLQNGRGPVEPINARSMLDAAATAAMTATAGHPPVERRRRLTPAALAVSNQKVGRAYSPIVIAGVVRVIDFAMLSAIGIALYFGYVVPLSGFAWEFLAAIFGVAATAVICFQAADIYQVQLFRGQSAPDDPDDFILGVRVPAVHRRILHRQARQRNFAALAHGVFLLGHRGAGDRAAVLALAGARLGPSGPARSPHHHRGRGRERRGTGPGAQDSGRFRHQGARRVRRPQRRPRAWTPAPAARSSARSTTSSSWRAAPASTSCCSRCRSRRRRAFSRC